MAEFKVIFSYNGRNEAIMCKKDEYMIDIYKKYEKAI